tara:strand:+ start:159 stop:446 length:288 start_codon:yes stop_codon:yes gene_type:complete
MWEKYPRQNPDTPTRTIQGEAVVITPDDSQLHNLNQTATLIWERSNGTQSLEEIFEEMLMTYEVEAGELRADIIDFIEESQSKGMLELFESANPL